MSEKDRELEHLMKKRLDEMQKNLSQKQMDLEKKTEKPKNGKPTNRDLLLKCLGYRGLEVLQNAEYQFPQESKLVVDKLGELIATDEINETIDGGKLLAVFRSVGINVRMETTINIEQDGKFVSLSDKLKSKSPKTEEREKENGVRSDEHNP